MLGTFGFSYVGLTYLLMLFIPNLVWSKNKPGGYEALAKHENKILLAFERIGQVLVTSSALLFADYNFMDTSAWIVWLVASFALMLMYEICWLRYFLNKTLENFYGKFLQIPVPLASLPVFGFLLLGIYGRVIWLIVSSVLLGVGHIGIHLQHLNKIK